jgi:hypothetical protein
MYSLCLIIMDVGAFEICINKDDVLALQGGQQSIPTYNRVQHLSINHFPVLHYTNKRTNICPSITFLSSTTRIKEQEKTDGATVGVRRVERRSFVYAEILVGVSRTEAISHLSKQLVA